MKSMKINIKHLGFYALLGMMPFSVTSCNDLLDLEPVSQITSEVYYETADQLASYLNNYYNSFLQNPYNGYMYHEAAYNDGSTEISPASYLGITCSSN